jgi:FtsH-binding integral membrane protein
MEYQTRYRSATVGSNALDIDQGLRAFMLGVYNRMAGALALTGLVAYWASGALLPLINGGMWLVLALLPLPFVLAVSYGVYRFSLPVANALFWLFSAAMGLSLSTIFVRYTSASIAQVFFITAGTFAAASLYGYTTRKDLSSMGGFLMMGLFGIIIASLVNIFLASSALTFVVSVIAVLIFTGLTAYDTQEIKQDYLSNGAVFGFDSPGRSAIYGALNLYLDFINIMTNLLQLIGVKRD